MSPNDLITVEDIFLLCYSITHISFNHSSSTQHTKVQSNLFCINSKRNIFHCFLFIST